MDKMNELTSKQQRFCQKYIKDYNATEAYLRAGYNAGNRATAAVKAHYLLKKGNISEEISRLKEQQIERVHITQDQVLMGLFSEAIDKSKTSTQSARVQAWTQLGRYFGMFKDNVNLNVEGMSARMRAAEQRVVEYQGTEHDSAQDEH